MSEPIHIRWMIRLDMPEVLRIESGSFEFPWRKDDFIRCLRQRNVIGMVAERGDRVIGYMLYELHKQRLHLLNLAVAKDYRRQGVGAAMVEKLCSKLQSDSRNRVMLEVRDRNLIAQLFFKSCGFRAVSVLRGFWDDCGDDAYLMQCQMEPPEAETNLPASRIRGLV